ncbi:MAG: POTRA domain-containing protein [Vicinamibacterales bacterium]
MLVRVAVLILALVCSPALADADIINFLGRRLVAIQVEVGGAVIDDPAVLELIETRTGELLTQADVRETIDHLTGLRRFEDIRVYASEADDTGGGGVILRWSLVPVQRPTRVRFVGSPIFSDAELETVLAARPDRSLSPSRVPAMIETLQRFYADRGYHRASITSRLTPARASNDAAIELIVNPGVRTTIAAVTLRGTPLESERAVLQRLGVRVGQPYDRPELERRLERDEERLRGLGYYEAEIQHAELFAEDAPTASLTITYEPGPRVRVVFAGEPLPEGRRDDLVPIRQERSVEEDLLEDAVRNIERYLRGEGYRDATVRYVRTEKDNEVVLTFTVERGPLHRIASVEVTGTAALTAEELAPLLKLTVGEPFIADRVATIASAITELYQVRGFPVATVTVDTPVLPAVVSDGVTYRPVAVQLVVSEGQRTLVGEVAIDGASAIEEARLRPLLGLVPGRPFYRPQLAADRESLERLYRNEGFQRATIQAEPTISEDGDRVNLRWTVREGAQARVDHLLVSGNERTSADVIRREVVLTPGTPLGEEGLVESQRRLSALGLFRRVRITELPHGASANRDVLVEVEEAPSTTVSYGGGVELQRRPRPGVDGVADDRFEVAPRAFFEIGRRNLWGKNRSLTLFTRASFRRRNASVETPNPTGEYGFNEYRFVGTFREPRAFRTPGDVQLTGFVEQAIRASYSFRRRGIRAEYARRLAQMVTVSGRYTFDRTKLFDTQIAAEDQPAIDRLFPQVRLSTLTGSVLRDTRDDVLDPQRGTVVGLDGSTAVRAFGSEVGFVRAFAQGFYYRSLPGSSRFVLVTGARLGLARGYARDVLQVDESGAPVTVTVKELPASERFFAGGDTTVRGFALDRLGTNQTLDPKGFPAGGNGLLVINAELRSPYWKGLGLVGFADAGNVYKLASDIDLSDVRGATGFGIRYRSPLGPLRVDLGFKLDPRVLANGNRERRAILHVSIGQAF